MYPSIFSDILEHTSAFIFSSREEENLKATKLIPEDFRNGILSSENNLLHLDLKLDSWFFISKNRIFNSGIGVELLKQLCSCAVPSNCFFPLKPARRVTLLGLQKKP